MGVLVDNATSVQKMAGGLSICLSTTAMITGFYWGSQTNPVDAPASGWLDGMTVEKNAHWKCTIHACLMIFAMCFCYSQALTSYRVYHFLGHTAAKVIHGIWHLTTAGVMLAALILIVQFHNEVQIGHLSSFHSWLGVLVVCIYSQNWVLGVLSFALPGVMTPEFKAKYMPSHRFLGIMGYFVATCAMMAGIMQKSWLAGGNCMYVFENYADEKYNPALGYAKIKPGCQMGYGVGMLIILNAICVMFSLWDFSYAKNDDDNNGKGVRTIAVESFGDKP